MDTMDVTQPVEILANILIVITVIITGCIALATLSYSAYCAVYCRTAWAKHVRDDRDDDWYMNRYGRRETIVHNLGPGVTVTCNTVEESSEEDDAIPDPHKSD